MVRFHWPCDAGQNSFVPPNGVDHDETNGVTHVSCEMEVGNQQMCLLDVVCLAWCELNATYALP